MEKQKGKTKGAQGTAAPRRWRGILMAAVIVCGICLPSSSTFFPVGAETGGTSDTAPVEPSDSPGGEAGSFTGSSTLDSRIPKLETSISYKEFLEQHDGTGYGTQPVSISGSGFESLEDMPGGAASGEGVQTMETGSVTWKLQVPAAGLYNLEVDYFPTAGKGATIERAVLINGALPYSEAGSVLFRRAWVDENKNYKEQEGNQVFPSQVESPQWMTQTLYDVNGFYREPLKFYFQKGENTLTLRSTAEPMEVKEIRLAVPQPLPEYRDYLEQKQAGGAEIIASASVKVQAEDALVKSSPSFYPLNNRTSVKTEPYHPSNIVMNTIGGSAWAETGDWIQWEVEVPKSGLYRIVTRFQQSESKGLFTTRKVSINGEIPFQEAEDVRFPYSGQFQVSALSDPNGRELLFYFEEGTNVISMEASLGAFSNMIKQVESSTSVLNSLYRDIVVITSTTPDKYRDYQFDIRLPQMVPTMQQEVENLGGVLTEMQRLAGGSDKTAVLSKTILQLKEMIQDQDAVAKNLTSLKDNITALGKWTLDIKSQPLTLDYLLLCGSGDPLPKAEGNFFQNVWHEIQAFAGSFTNDFTPVSANSQKESVTLDVWVTTGRDQMEVIRRLINETFESEENIKVNLKLVNADVLLPATFTGRGPDVAIQIGSTLPVNFAFRDAAYDLTGFPDFQEVSQRFLPGAMEYFQYGDGFYALPDQMSFPVLFYRKDILAELQVPVPDTWDDVISIVPYLQKGNMEIYLDTATQLTLGSAASVGNSKAVNSVFLSMLYQNDGELYNEDGSRCEIDQPIGVDVFKRWTEFYTKHSFPKEADFVTRFRIGEIPLGVVDFTTYNKLSVSAPEIRGVWDIAPIPGTLQADGTVRRDTPCITSASLIVKNSVERRGTLDASWEFLKWWTDANTQTQYAREMETILGPAARYPVSNLESFQQAAWPVGALKVLNSSLEWVRGVPQVPGSYITGRSIDNAFKAVINDSLSPNDNIFDYTEQINDEIKKKRVEFGLEENPNP